MKMFENKVGLVLPGGGARGAYQIGVLKGINEILPDRVKNPFSIKKFRAEVSILHHPTTIKLNYQPTIHCGTVRQTAKIYKMSKELVRTGDSAIVDFEFLFKPEYIQVVMMIVRT